MSVGLWENYIIAQLKLFNEIRNRSQNLNSWHSKIFKIQSWIKLKRLLIRYSYKTMSWSNNTKLIIQENERKMCVYLV